MYDTGYGDIYDTFLDRRVLTFYLTGSFYLVTLAFAGFIWFIYFWNFLDRNF
jgi:hypothetical protein